MPKNPYCVVVINSWVDDGGKDYDSVECYSTRILSETLENNRILESNAQFAFITTGQILPSKVIVPIFN